MLKNKRVAVFGGTSGIGRSVARAAWTEGADVVVIGRNGLPENEPHESVDVRDEGAVGDFFERQAPFDHVVSTVGSPARRREVQEISREEAEEHFAVKYWGQFFVLKHAVRGLKPGGSIVLTTGLSPARPAVGFATQAAISGALEALVRTHAVELAPVRLNAVCPGNIESEKLFSELSAEAVATRVLSANPMAGLLEHAAQSYLFALTNSHLTGQILVVDGGGSLAGL